MAIILLWLSYYYIVHNNNNNYNNYNNNNNNNNKELQVPDLHQGRLPLGGGLAYHLVNNNDNNNNNNNNNINNIKQQKSRHRGAALARFVCLGNWVCSCEDLRYLDMLTHITEQTPHRALLFALAHTIPTELLLLLLYL